MNQINPDAYGSSQSGKAGSQTWSKWLTSNLGSILFSVVALALVLYYLNVIDVIKVAVGLGLVIFIHELGHFLAAKWCDVHVETFSIGFGKPLPGCHFKYGETTYKIGWIPLGGFVKMIGEGENADTDEAEEDPRSFKNKPIGQRMLIISAGVTMNVILACICFIIVYSHGVEEIPPIIGWVEPGSPAWEEGIHSEVILEQIDNLKKPVFDDIRPIVMGTSKDETVRFYYRNFTDAKIIEAIVKPARDSEALYPVVGVGPALQLTLATSRRPDFKPFHEGSPAALAEPRFRGGDKVIACSDDPSNPDKVSPIPADERDGAAGKLDYFVFQRRQQIMRGKKMIVRVLRGNDVIDVTLNPAYHATTGMIMEMGRVAARRKDSPAASAKVLEPTGEEPGIQPCKTDVKEPTGDKIILVEVINGKGQKVQWQPDQKSESTVNGVVVKPLDPLRLPFELEQWAEQKPESLKVTMRVLRTSDRKEEKKKDKPVLLELEWDPSAKFSREILTTPNSPISIPCLGIAYYVDAVVEDVLPNTSAASAGMQKGDLIKEIRWKELTSKGDIKQHRWQEIKSYQWAYVFNALQAMEPKEIDLKVERSGGISEVTLKAEADESWPMAERGIFFQNDKRLHKAEDLLDAIGLGMHRTVRTVRMIYQNLYALRPIFGRVSVWTMSGPLTIAEVSYRIAGYDLWQFILFIGMINVNLAVINFLPIPVLDGGHMVFLIYEKIRGKPAPESVLGTAMYIGLALILTLMCFVLFNDVKNQFF